MFRYINITVIHEQGFLVQESLCDYVILLMAIYWIAEVLPLAVTAFLPIILFPTMGVMTTKAVNSAYFHDLIWTFSED